ncbi:unnamed protein product [Mytilus coruscus]|uniref:WSC domain-containing protein n=1 Tax=Mytilus coruscus TaxID=42192 RepID=A0A6J8F1B4_MYTCO|nr:unnamed protein product [Mytilus coruscus]
MVFFQVIHFQIVFNFLHWIFYTVQIIYSIEVKYLGCYVDDSDRMLSYSEWRFFMSLEMCKQLCFKRKDKYLGLQASYECFCGDSLGDPGVYNKTNDSECNRECPGNSSQICGGSWRNSVYEFITATVPTTELTTPGHSSVKTTNMTTPRQSIVTTTQIITLGQPNVTTTDMKTTGKSPMATLQIPKYGAYKVTTTEITTLGQPEMTSTVMKAHGKSTITNLQITKPRASNVKTTEIISLGQPEVTTTDMKTPRKSTITTLHITKPGASKEIAIKTTTILGKSEVTSLECLCPCSKVGKDKWNFLRGTNLTLGQLRQILKPELDLMKKELSINKSNTTRMRRSKISAPDDRISAKSVGYVGVVFICLITVIIVFIDMLGCIVAKF